MGFTRFFTRSRWDDERARELDAHLQLEIDANLQRGMTPDDARAAARRKLGNTTLVREEIYQMNTLEAVDSVWRDLKHGLRLLRLNPGFALVAILSLALGVGANTAIFQLLDAVRIRTLPVADPAQLLEIRIDNPPGGRTGAFMSRRPMLTNPLFERLREQQQAFSGLAAWSTTTFNMAPSGEARQVAAMWVNGDFFRTLGVTPMLGRLIGEADDRRGCAAPPAVISYGFWQRQFGGDAAILGRTLTLERHGYEIVGVTPPQFFGVEVGRTYDVAVPLCAEPMGRATSALDRPDSWFLGVFGRLQPGWTVERARAHVEAISANLFQATLPPRYRPIDASNYLKFKLGVFPAATGVSTLRTQYETPLWMLLATTGLVLVIACANLANLMLARATTRDREIAVRLAIGASRWRIVRQLLAESLLLSILGGIGGLIVARLSSRFLVALMTTESNRLFVDLPDDWRVFGFAAALAVGTCIIFGLAPALRVTASEPGAAMKAGSRGSTDTRERFGVRRGLVIVQVALSLVLVVGALLFVRSLRNLMVLDAGFRQDGILVLNVDLRGAALAAEARRRAYDELGARLRAIPGVENSAEASIVPVSGSGWNNTIVIDGKTYSDRAFVVNFNSVGAGYFATMATPMLAGRDFNGGDTPASPRVAIVTEQFSRKFFDGANPVGRRFQVDEGVGVDRPVFEIVGLVKDVKYTNLREEFTPIAFLAASQDDKPDPDVQFVLRTSLPLASATAQAGAAVAAAHPASVVRFQLLNTLVHDSLMRERLMAMLSAFFGLLAVLLATIGLYGVMAYMVERRRNEIGIRMALGADRRIVVRMVMREALTLLVAGLLVGSLAAIGAARWASALLFGLKPGDPVTLAAAIVTLAAVAALASYIPAWRASRLEPTIALREE